jgi:hypothetical protein
VVGAWGDHPPSGVVGGGPRVTWRRHGRCCADVSPWLVQREHPNCTTFCNFSFPGARRLAQKEFRCAAGRLDGIWYPLLRIKRQNTVLYELVLEPREAMYVHRQYQPLISRSAFRCASGKKSPPTSIFAQDSPGCKSKPGGLPSPSIPAGPGRARRARPIQPLISEGSPLKKSAACAPTRGKRQRGTARGTAMWPAGLPQPPPHLVDGPPRHPPRPGRRKNGPVRPLER